MSDRRLLSARTTWFRPFRLARYSALSALAMIASGVSPCSGKVATPMLTVTAVFPLARLSAAVFAWYQSSREGNTAGLRRADTQWTPGTRLRRREALGLSAYVLASDKSSPTRQS